MELLAVVHDLSQDPTWREEWVAAALREIFEQAEALEVRTLEMPILGAVHGRLPLRRFLSHLRKTLDSQRPPTLERLWLTVRPGQQRELQKNLETLGRSPHVSGAGEG